MELVIETSAGRVRGRVVDGVRSFRGIPYAAPPVGARRFRPPQPVEPWAGVRDAGESAPAAPQNGGPVARMLGMASGETSEDCLTLDVWAPAESGEGRPVMVWIHGGSFTFGAGSQPVYDAVGLVQRGDVVVVNLHYRLGALGWLALPALEREEGGSLGNAGLLDQIEALRFVRENARAFGGDPERVTLFGESAGAMSIGALLAAPAAAGLFQRAILQSGAAHHASPADRAVEMSERWVRELGLDAGDVGAFRELPVERVLEAQAAVQAVGGFAHRGLPYQPTVDGRILPRAPHEALGDGSGAAVPLLVGTNLDEWKLFGLGDPKARELDDAALLRRCGRNLPEGHAGRLVAGYRAAREQRSASTAPHELWFAIESDRNFRLPAIRLAESQHRRGLPCWMYLFTWASPALDGAVGSCHALEIPFVFGLSGDASVSALVGDGDAARELSRHMQDAWLAFAQEGTPAAAGLPEWAPYDEARRTTLILGAECRREDDPLGDERALWAELV
ncbi:MAG: carboxylesterase/lipase family protein [Deltaproteobacteria bacterium]|nr:carboxylesterase/lipase family protein [Deltaproteobacteria bacterium]MBW2445266.1 carboxylesterase/lipase family protein [Deltaproteobacteria bacterium]